ncbi:OmpH family outer membrane protein [Luteolibacter sp. GHJ8]|uniref:OmpH family outer membrane protein n=1 Tax=Luteolibacter rhizosphaerae TaxID=2989719 RepID=A0ABT3FXT8_9BACT|nr:OmpH family outer membrane protein [Luteolibacter rhizosphaerae]MCW1912378.1 OmpH family outer membrane protein [Luteolibacter rhizosphaerae]
MPLSKDLLQRLSASVLIALAISNCREKPQPIAQPREAPPPVEAPTPTPRLKIATVDVQQVFKDYHRTAAYQKEQHAQVALIQSKANERLEVIRQLEADIRTLDKQLADPAIAPAKKQVLVEERRSKFQDGVALERERTEFMQSKHKALQENSAERARAFLDEIQVHIAEKAKEGGIDYVFDKSASGFIQTPFFIHTPEADDMTAEVIASLNRDAPRQEEAGLHKDTR